MAPEALFVYGTLRFADVLAALLRRVPNRTPGTVTGWRAAALPDRVYPVLVPGEGTVDGYLLTDLSPGEWLIIDAFEDAIYDLEHLRLVDGRHGWAYVGHDQSAALGHDWSPDTFAARHLTAYAHNCATWRHHQDASSQAGRPPDP